MCTDDDEETNKTIESSTDGARKAILQELSVPWCHGAADDLDWAGSRSADRHTQ